MNTHTLGLRKKIKTSLSCMYTPRSGTDGSYDNSVFVFLRNCLTDFHRICTAKFHQQDGLSKFSVSLSTLVLTSVFAVVWSGFPFPGD